MTPKPAVRWADLLRLSRADVGIELTLSVPWLVASWVAASQAAYAAALAFSFMFFLTGLRQTHNAYHDALGLSRRATHWVMFQLSIAMLGSMHAIQVNHLRHHRFCMNDEDIEALSARLPWWRAILVGPLFPIRLHCKALEVGTRKQRQWIAAELAANGLWIALVFGVFDVAWLKYHVCAMAAGQCLTSFFAVWTVHHGCDNDNDNDGCIARTVRGRVKALLTYNMFFHAEHHRFPGCPPASSPCWRSALTLWRHNWPPSACSERAFWAQGAGPCTRPVAEQCAPLCLPAAAG